jgi:hypothetical protein
MEGFSWPKVQRGYQELKKLYGVSPVKMIRLAFMAYTVHDKAAAKETFADLGPQWERTVWAHPANLESARAWAATPLP